MTDLALLAAMGFLVLLAAASVAVLPLTLLFATLALSVGGVLREREQA